MPQNNCQRLFERKQRKNSMKKLIIDIQMRKEEKKEYEK